MVYMNGAITELSAIINKPPRTNIITIIGANQSFFLTFKKRGALAIIPFLLSFKTVD